VINWVQFLQCPPPKISDGQKIAQNLSRLLTTFDFDREYFRNESTYQKSEKFLIIYNPSHVRPIDLAYFGPQTKKLLTLVNVHPNGIFSGNYISARRGCCAMKFLYALQIDQGYLAHTPTGTGVPPKNFNRENWPKIQRVRLNIFRASGSILTGLFQSTSREAVVIKWAQFLQCPPPKICDGKKSPKFFAIFDNFRL